MAEVLHRGGGGRQCCRLVQDLIAEETVDALIQSFAVLKGPQQAECLVIMDAQFAAEPLGKGSMDIESFGPG